MAKAALVALVLTVLTSIAVRADASTSLVSSMNPSFAGQAVTFTATFTHSCSDGVDSATFTIDGRAIAVQARGDPTATAAISLSSLGVGSHTVAFDWSASQPLTSITCGGHASLTQMVRARPAPTASPTAQPSPAAQPSPTPSPPAPTPSPTPPATASVARVTVRLDAGQSGSTVELVALAGIAVLVVLALAGPRIRRR